jgi:hypothetical protein
MQDAARLDRRHHFLWHTIPRDKQAFVDVLSIFTPLCTQTQGRFLLSAPLLPFD